MPEKQGSIEGSSAATIGSHGDKGNIAETTVSDPNGLKNDVVELSFSVMEGVVISLIGIVIIAALTKLRDKISAFFLRFTPRNFGNRRDHYKCRKEGLLEEEVGPPGNLLTSSTLLGPVEIPSIYGVFQERGGSTRISREDRKLGKKFKRLSKQLSNRIVPYRVNLKTPASKKSDNWEDDASAPYILEKHIIPALKNPEPQLIVITGKVGCGKSTLILDIANHIDYYNVRTAGLKDVAVLVIDTRSLLYKHFRFDEEFHRLILNPSFCNEVVGAIEREIVRLLVEMGVPGVTIATNYKDSIEACYKARLSPLIALDELDYLYTEFSRRLVANKNGPTNRCVEVTWSSFSLQPS